MRTWIKDPLAILAEDAERGLVVDGARIVECIPDRGRPGMPVAREFDAGRHVVVPGLVNTHHHFYQTLTRACPAAIDKELFAWLEALYPIWANLEPRGVRLAVDGSASADCSNLMQELRQAFFLQRMHYGAARISHRDAFRWATEGEARCLGRDDIGVIAPGKQADLALFTPDELRFSGHGDPLAALVLCGAHRADRVMVAGRWVVEEGTIPGLDLPALMAEHQRAARALQQ